MSKNKRSKYEDVKRMATEIIYHLIECWPQKEIKDHEIHRIIRKGSIKKRDAQCRTPNR